MIKNQLKTVLLLGALTGLFLALGAFFGGRAGLFIGLLFTLGMNFVSYWWSARIVLWMYRAKEADAKEYTQLYSTVKEIAHTAGLPMPKVYIVPSEHPNAFACGRSQQHSVIAYTQGILKLLNEHELKGVTAHELSHIKNRDVLISTISATIAGVISYIAMMARWSAIFSGLGNDDNKSSGIVELLVLGILAPLMAMIIQLAISRSREYLADETGVKIIKDSSGLASALEKLEKGIQHAPLIAQGTTGATAHLFIENPFKGKSFWNIFNTHPSTSERVKRLRTLKF